MFSYLHQPKGFYKHLFLLALPVIVQNLITTSLGFLDTFMVGLLGSEQMSAVTVANVPIFIIQLIVFGLQSGSSVLISQYWGRGDRESINRVMGIGFMIAGGVSVLFAAILCAFPAQVLYLITDNLTLVELAEPYLRIVGFSYIFNSLSSIYIGMQRSIENPRFGMIVFAISMLCNTLGNYVLIFGKLGLPALGITGAAVATLLSRVVSWDYQDLIEEHTPTVASTLEISEKALAALDQGMRMTGTIGTAEQYLRDYPIPIACKTGTAQWQGTTSTGAFSGSDHASFVLYAPADDPEIAIAVYVERGSQGGNLANVCIPILDAYFSSSARYETVTTENIAY